MKAAHLLTTISALSLTTAGAATYTVKSGDTLSKIASAYGTNAAALMRLNGLRSTTIQVGQRLQIGSGFTKTNTAAATTARTTSRTSVSINTAASRYLGIRYALGGTGSWGIDCSAYTQRVFQQLGINLPRTAAAQWGVGYAVSSRNLQPGDLVFFDTAGAGRVTHVGIYLGDDQFVNANSYQGKVTVDRLLADRYWAPRYLGARRVLGGVLAQKN